MNEPRILVVEDEEIVAGYIEEVLSSRGFQVELAYDGETAWERLARDSDFETILLDRAMPRLDGMALLGRLKCDPELARIPVVMATATGDAENIRTGLDAGAYYYLVKPLQRDLLLAVVQAAVAQRRDYQAMREALRDAERTLAWLDQGLFRFRTPEAARILANALARACPYPEKTVLGLWELMINAVEHGNLGITYGEKSLLMTDGCWIDEVEARLALPEHRSKQVEVLFERDPTEITITIRDQGKGFDWRKYLELDPDRAFDPHGRGIAMARLISFRELEYLGSGDTVRVRITAADETG